MQKTRRKRLAIIPRIVLSSTFLGIIPACAIASCGDESGDAHDAGNDHIFAGDVSCCGDSQYFDTLKRDAPDDAVDDAAVAADADALAPLDGGDAPIDATPDGNDAG